MDTREHMADPIPWLLEAGEPWVLKRMEYVSSE
jgi:hypothetical protein